MGEIIRVRSDATDAFVFDAYRAAPAGERRGGVIVLQEIFGLDEHVRRDVDRWASLGYEAIAPSLFDRREPGFVAGHDPDGLAAGIAHARATPMDQALADNGAVRDVLIEKGKVFVVGYCYGGSLAWLAACRLHGLSGASSYYGSLVLANAALKPKCPVIVHLGRLDTGIPADEVKAAVQTHHPEIPVHIYDEAGHGFNNEDPARFHAESARLARQRTLDLFASA
jgi:carboxymethylenebutenolidase